MSGTILVVDDNVTTLDLWLRQGEFFGYGTIACHDGDQMIDIMTTRHIDLVLLQIIMEKVNGFELLEKIRSNENFNNIPIIAIFPIKARDLALKCFKMGANDYLIQPLQLAIFKARVNDCIEKKKHLDKEKEYIFNIKKQKEEVEKLMLESMPRQLSSASNMAKSLSLIEAKRHQFYLWTSQTSHRS